MSNSSDQPALQNQQPLSIELPDDPKEFKSQINDRYQKLAASTNSKEGGLYVPQEKTNNQQYFDPLNTQRFRNVYRMVVDFGALPNATSKSVAHKIPGWNSSYRLTRAYGAATDKEGLQAEPIPNVGIKLLINQTNVIITTTTNESAFTASTVVIEYTKG